MPVVRDQELRGRYGRGVLGESGMVEERLPVPALVPGRDEGGGEAEKGR